MATLAAVSPLQEAISLIIRDSGVSKILTMVEEGERILVMRNNC